MNQSMPDEVRAMIEGLTSLPGVGRVEVVNLDDGEGSPLGQMFAHVYTDFLAEFTAKACDSLRHRLGIVVGEDQLEHALAEAGLRPAVSQQQADDIEAARASEAFDRDTLVKVLTSARDALAEHHRASEAAVAAVRRTRDVAVGMGIIETDTVSDL